MTPERRKEIELCGIAAISRWGMEIVAELLTEIDRLTPTLPVLNAEGLRECPFCGCQSVRMIDATEYSNDGAVCIECPECKSSGPVVWSLMEDGKPKAISRWNTRTTVAAPALRDEVIERLEKENRRARVQVPLWRGE